MRYDTQILSASQIELAAAYLKKGELVAMPTETVYGLAGDATKDSAVEAIYKAKGRALDNPFIIHFSAKMSLADYGIKITSLGRDLLYTFSPGPLTVIVPKSRGISAIAKAGLETLALRIPAHPLAQKLIDKVGRPLAAPSANLSGRYSSTTAQMAYDQLKGSISAVLDGGPCDVGIESTVIQLEEHQVRILRFGSITQADMAEIVGAKRVVVDTALLAHESLTKQPVSPGMKYAHYRPITPLKLFKSANDLPSDKDYSKSMILSIPTQRLAPRIAKEANSVIEYESMQLYGQALYYQLAKADDLALESIYAYWPDMLAPALSDRLLRAAAYQFIS